MVKIFVLTTKILYGLFFPTKGQAIKLIQYNSRQRDQYLPRSIHGDNENTQTTHAKNVVPYISNLQVFKHIARYIMSKWVVSKHVLHLQVKLYHENSLQFLFYFQLSNNHFRCQIIQNGYYDYEGIILSLEVVQVDFAQVVGLVVMAHLHQVQL